MHRTHISYIHLDREHRLLFRGVESGGAAGESADGQSEKMAKAKATVDALMRDPSRNRDGKSLYDRVEDAKKTLASSKDVRASKILSTINDAYGRMVAEQANWPGKSANNPEHVRAYRQPWTDLFVALEEFETASNTPEFKSDTSDAARRIRTPETKVSPEAIAHAKATIMKHIQTWNKELFKDFNPETATGEVKAAYDHLETVVMKWETNQHRNNDDYNAAWIALKEAVQALKTSESTLDGMDEKQSAEIAANVPDALLTKEIVSQFNYGDSNALNDAQAWMARGSEWKRIRGRKDWEFSIANWNIYAKDAQGNMMKLTRSYVWEKADSREFESDKARYKAPTLTNQQMRNATFMAEFGQRQKQERDSYAYPDESPAEIEANNALFEELKAQPVVKQMETLVRDTVSKYIVWDKVLQNHMQRMSRQRERSKQPLGFDRLFDANEFTSSVDRAVLNYCIENGTDYTREKKPILDAYPDLFPGNPNTRSSKETLKIIDNIGRDAKTIYGGSFLIQNLSGNILQRYVAGRRESDPALR